MDLVALPPLVVEEEVVFFKKDVLYRAPHYLFEGYRIEDDTKRVHRIVELEVVAFVTDVFGKAGAHSEYPRGIVQRMLIGINRYGGRKLH